MGSLAPFVRLSRLKFLTGGFAGAALGTAIAAFQSGAIDWRAYALAQLTLTSFHLMTHYSNDYFDREADALSVRTPFSGGSGALVDGSLAPVVALRAALVCAAVGTLGSACLLSAGRPLAAALGALVGCLSWSYSGPPFRLLATGFGEAETALVVAILLPLCAYSSQPAQLDARAIASTLPGAAAMFAMMLGVEFPDRAADAIAGKRNMLVRLGGPAAVKSGTAAAFAVYLFAALAVAAGAPPIFGIALALTLPISVAYAKTLRRAGEDCVYAAAPAGPGVALFFIVAVYGALAYALAAAAPR